MKRKILRGFRFRMSELGHWAYERSRIQTFALKVIDSTFSEFGNPESEADFLSLHEHLARYADYLAQHEPELGKLRGLPELQTESEGFG